MFCLCFPHFFLKALVQVRWLANQEHMHMCVLLPTISCTVEVVVEVVEVDVVLVVVVDVVDVDVVLVVVEVVVVIG